MAGGLEPDNAPHRVRCRGRDVPTLVEHRSIAKPFGGRTVGAGRGGGSQKSKPRERATQGQVPKAKCHRVSSGPTTPTFGGVARRMNSSPRVTVAAPIQPITSGV